MAAALWPAVAAAPGDGARRAQYRPAPPNGAALRPTRPLGPARERPTAYRAGSSLPRWPRARSGLAGRSAPEAGVRPAHTHPAGLPAHRHPPACPAQHRLRRALTRRLPRARTGRPGPGPRAQGAPDGCGQPCPRPQRPERNLTEYRARRALITAMEANTVTLSRHLPNTPGHSSGAVLLGAASFRASINALPRRGPPISLQPWDPG